MVQATKILTDYLENIFVPELFQQLVPRAIQKARSIHVEHPYDAIAFTGTSGCSIGFILGYTLNIPIICIRKPDQESHYKSWSCEEIRSFEGFNAPQRYLIVDDGICSGKTVERIMTAINNSCGKCRCVAMLMFNSNSYWINNIYHPKDAELSHLHKDGIYVYSCAQAA